MSETGQQIAQRTPEQKLLDTIRSDDFGAQIEMVLPETVTKDRFIRAFATSIMSNADLAKAEPQSVVIAAIRAAQDGLLPDGKEAAIVVFNTKVKDDQGERWVAKAQYMAMIGGLRKLVADHGWTLRTRVVRDGDEFVWSEEPPALSHRPALTGDGAITHAYAIATHRDGRRIQRVAFAHEIDKRKQVAKTKDVWDKWPAEMSEKTVGRMLFDEIPRGDLDEDRERIARILATWENDPSQAVDAIYGPAAPALEHQAARELSQGSSVLEPPTDGASGPDGSEQVGGGGQENPPATNAAAGSSPTPEPSLTPAPEPPLDGEPNIEFGVPAAAVVQAGQTVIESQGMTVDEILSKDAPGEWVRWAVMPESTLSEGERAALDLVVRERRPELLTPPEKINEAA